MSLIDRARVRLAAWWYGFWLEFHSIPGRRRRELKRELRANLVDAAAASSARRAIQDLDGLRALAGAVARDGIARPRWQTAGVAAAVTFGVIVNVEFIAALNWVSGVVDGGERAATGVVFPFPGSVVTYEPPGYGMVLEPGWLPFIGPLLIFVLLARPWRLLRRSSGSPLVGLRHD